MPVVSELDILQQSLNDALNHFRDEMAELKLPLLSNGDTQRHPMDQAGFVDSPRLYEARRLILASLGELKNLIQNPFQKVIEKASGLYDAACLDIFVLTGIVDKLAEPCAIKEGLDAETLSKQLDLDKAKLVVIMRYLAADGWVLEIREERFRLCRPSLELLAGYGGRSWILYPIRANVARNLITQVSSDWKYSSESNKSAFQLAQNTSLSIWAWMEQHPAIREKYARAIQGRSSLHPRRSAFGDAFNQALTSDISWKRFDGWQFVDCAGGLGNLSISLAQILPKSRFIVQDQPEVVEYARQNFTKSAQELVDTGRIEAEAFDLFKIQPRTGDQIVYLLRLVLHDWPDKDSKEILRNIAASMSPSSRVFILEQIVQVRNPPELNVATAADLSELKNAGEFRSIVPPPYLPADLGAAGKTTTVLNMTMLATMNAHERTLRDWTSIISSVGLKVTEVHYTRGVLSGIECARFAF